MNQMTCVRRMAHDVRRTLRVVLSCILLQHNFSNVIRHISKDTTSVLEYVRTYDMMCPMVLSE